MIRLAKLWLVIVLAGGAPAWATLMFPTFAANINSDPNAATIKATINAALAIYQATFADPITVNITFQEGSTGLGSSSSFFSNVSYANYLAALTADSKTADDTTALAHLPTVAQYLTFFGTTNISVKTANLRAVGINVAPPSDGTITLNTSIMNLDRTSPQNPAKYDLMAVAMHEIDEVLGLGSALPTPLSGNPFAEDLFRYNAGGRSYNAANGTLAYFSIDGTNLMAQFHNTNDGADYGDWESQGLARVQDAFATPGAQPNLGVELRALDVIGFDSAIPEPATGVLMATALAFLWGLARYGRRFLRTA